MLSLTTRTSRQATRLLIAQQQRFAHARNTIINFVPQQEAWVVERMGRYHKILEPGLNLLLPVIDKIKYVQSLKEIAIEIPQQGAITVDNVQLHLDGVLYLRVVDPFKASYGVEDPEFAITQLAQTTMRSEVGKISLDTVFREREQLNISIVDAINKAANPWGLVCMRYEIRDMSMPAKIQEAMQMQVEADQAMQMQVEADRKKRAAILESEGQRDAAINVAEGEKQARILRSEAHMREKINEAEGQKRAVELNAEARMRALEMVASSLNKEGGQNAASLTVAEQYVSAFKSLAKDTNTVIVPQNVSDVNGMVAQAMTVYKKLSSEELNRYDVPSVALSSEYRYHPRQGIRSSVTDRLCQKEDKKQRIITLITTMSAKKKSGQKGFDKATPLKKVDKFKRFVSSERPLKKQQKLMELRICMCEAIFEENLRAPFLTLVNDTTDSSEVFTYLELASRTSGTFSSWPVSGP
uniref:PHB domain-containing protein n=1 Tax=Steinernema glaseri TaxID=37863 RepID=A0A1I7Z987_9BILA